ncbi:PAS domain-containing protein [Limnobacter sp.]|uniref:PAS domain-containing protein n=1 Tax=Limnobacter sp. TaxID=2003368 RepID=UPI00351624F5
MSSPKEINEAVRLTELYQLAILDTDKEEFFEALVELGISAFNSAFCFIAFLDSERQWFKAKRGFEVREIPRQLSICAHTIKSGDPHVINNCLEHPIFKSNPLVLGSPWIRAYLGIPVETPSGSKVGTFCVLDDKAREWSNAEIKIATALAKLVSNSLAERSEKNQRPAGMGEADPPDHLGVPLGSWKTADTKGYIELSPSLERWLCLYNTRQVDGEWFNQLPVPSDREMVQEARLKRNGAPVFYQVRLPNGDTVRFEEQVYDNGDTDNPRLFGLIKKISDPQSGHIQGLEHIESAQPSPRTDPKEDLRRFPQPFLQETLKGRLLVDTQGIVLGCAFDADEDFTPAKIKGNLQDLLHQDDWPSLQQTLGNCAKDEDKGPLWIRLKSAEYQNTVLKMWVRAKGGFHAFKRPQLIIQFVAMINRQSTVQKSIFHETLLGLTGQLAKVGGWYYHLESGSLKVTDTLRDVLAANRESMSSIFHLSSLLTKMSGRNVAVLFIECINNRKPASLEFAYDASNGEGMRWYRMTVRPSVGEEGLPQGLYGALADITDTRRVEQALEKNLLTYNLIVDNLTDGLIEVDASLQVSFVNRNAKNLLQKDRELFVHATPLNELIPDLDQTQFGTLIESVNAVGFSRSVDQYLSAIKRWISLRVFRSGAGYTILIKDITKRKNQSSDLYMLNSAIEQIREVILVTNDIRKDKDPFGILYVNSAFETMVGQGREKWIGRNPYHLIHGRIPTRDYRKLLVAFLSRQKVLVKTTYEQNGGAKLPCDILVSPFLDTARNAPCFLIVFRVFE